MDAITLTTISDDDLVSRLTHLFEKERQLEVELIHHIREVERRQIHLRRGYPNLVIYLVQEFKVSEGTAVRKIQAMRLVQDLPQIVESIKAGHVSVTNASMVQTFFRNERKERNRIYTPQEKIEIVQQITNKTTREWERVLKTISPESVRSKDRERILSADEIEITCTISRELKTKLDRIKDLIAHKNPNPSMADLLDAMAEIALMSLDPGSKRQDAPPAPAKQCVKNPDSRNIPVSLKRKIWQRAAGCCEYTDPTTKRRCSSTYMLEIDHRHAFGYGGKSTDDNLRLLCRNHNVMAAVQVYGRQKMKEFIPRL